MKDILERIPPHSEEAEQGLLGSVLLAPESTIFLCHEQGVDESWFYIPSHRVIYEAVLEVNGKSRGIDAVTVGEHLRDLGMLEKIGGRMAINRIIDATPTTAHAEHYLGIIKEQWRRRSAIDQGRAIERAAYDGSADIIDGIGKAVNGLANIANSRKTVTTEQLMAEHRAMRARAKAGEQVGWQTPWAEMNSLLYGIREPHNVVVAAMTSSGKTALTMNMVKHFISQGANVAVSENDMSRSDLEIRMVGMMTGINPLIFRTQYFTSEDEARWEEGWRELAKMPLYINDQRMTMDETEAWAMAEKSRHGIDIFVFDFLQKTKRTKDEWRHSLREVVGDWSCRSCEIGKRMKAATICISQFSRSGNKEKDVTPPHPTLESLKETGEIENNADVVLLLSKKPGQPTNLFTGKYPVWDIDVDVAKHRNGPTDIVGMCLHIRSQRFMTRKQGDMLRDDIAREEDAKKD